MTYAKFLANAAWAGLYVTLFTASLLVLINGVPPEGSAVAGIARATASLAPIYVPATALLLSTQFLFLRFFAVRRLHARWQSLKAIVWFGIASVGGLTAVTYLNLRWIGSLLSPVVRETLRIAAAGMAASFLISCALASTAQFRAGAPARRLRVAGVMVLLAPLLALVMSAATLPASVIPRPVREPSPYPEETAGSMAEAGAGMVLAGFDAASMDQLLPLVAAGELPAFDRMMRRGASSRLNTVRPCAPSVAWAALLTGRPPWLSGRRATERQTLPFGPEEIDLMPRALGFSWLRRAGYVRAVEHGGSPWGDGAVWESARSAGLDAAVVGWESKDPGPGDGTRVTSRLQRILGEGGADGAAVDDPGLPALRHSLALDLASRDAALAALRGASPRLVAVRFPGLAEVARRYLRYHAPGEFGEPPGVARDPRARVLSGYYEFLDEILAEILERAGGDRFVMVVSSHGVEPLPPWERMISFLGPGSDAGDVSGSWRRGPDGVFLLAGPGVQPGARPEEVDLLDVAPTAAYLLGLPIEREMRGNLLRRLLQPQFLESHPVHFVPGQGAIAP